MILSPLLFPLEFTNNCKRRGGQKDNRIYIHTVGYDSAIKGKEPMTHATTWMNFKNIVLNERSQSQKATYCMIPFILHFQNR